VNKPDTMINVYYTHLVESGKIKLFIKGADSVIRERLSNKNKVDYEEITWKQLEVSPLSLFQKRNITSKLFYTLSLFCLRFAHDKKIVFDCELYSK
jgi:magnesium-transporting ATPase (P-type)